MSEADADQVAAGVKDQNLKLTLVFGIGMHHAGLAERDRLTVEELFVNQKIQVRKGLSREKLFKISNICESNKCADPYCCELFNTIPKLVMVNSNFLHEKEKNGLKNCPSHGVTIFPKRSFLNVCFRI